MYEASLRKFFNDKVDEVIRVDRPDKDYEVSWVCPYGKGRAFYPTLGHDAATYWNPVFLRHLLAGVQFAIGDLKGETAPIVGGH